MTPDPSAGGGAGLIPFYKRTLDSFADETITSVSQGSNGRWYAVLDWGPGIWEGLDFSTCCTTREEAVARCAHSIRCDARGIGRYAPHAPFRNGCNTYDFKFRLAKWWVEKEEAPAGRTALAHADERRGG